MLKALRCPECTAPIRELPGAGERGVCVYCGAALASVEPAAGRIEERFFVVLRVGPSNVDRVARVVHEHVGVDLERARALVARPPCEIAVGADDGLARNVLRAAMEAGALAEIATRTVTVPFLTVTLEDTGADKLAVIVALRAQIDLSVVEAKRIVGGTPCTLAAGVEQARAHALVAALEAAGAKASAR